MFLAFSDSAKFAIIARNITNGLGFGNDFSFWSSTFFNFVKGGIFVDSTTPPVMPFSIAAFFKIFGVNDFAVIATSFFFFILTLIFTYLLAKKVFNSKLVGALSTLAVGASYDIIHYATNGASESPFIFEIVAASYFASIKKKWANVLTLILLILMYFTRPMAFIYIAGIILYWLLNNLKTKKAIIIFGIILVVGFFFDRMVLYPLSGKMFLYSVSMRGAISATAQATTSVTSEALRGVETASIGTNNIQIFKNIFYNLYNFYKLMPQIISPYLFTLFALGLFIKSKTKEISSFKISVLFMFALTLLVVAASIPFFRYIHPVVPLVYIVAVGTLVTIINSQFKTSKQLLTILISTFLILLFGVGQTLGAFLLDSRFEKNTHNVGKPPIYVEFSKVLKENTIPDQTIITNLDTWGSWYGERKTIWFPLEPKQLIDPATGKVPFDAIYLTSYLMDDQNYYMGEAWRTIFDNPKDTALWICDGCPEIAREFKLGEIYQVKASDNYERQDGRAILLIKK